MLQEKYDSRFIATSKFLVFLNRVNLLSGWKNTLPVHQHRRAAINDFIFRVDEEDIESVNHSHIYKLMERAHVAGKS